MRWRHMPTWVTPTRRENLKRMQAKRGARLSVKKRANINLAKIYQYGTTGRYAHYMIRQGLNI